MHQQTQLHPPLFSSAAIRAMDPLDIVSQNPSTSFGEFCKVKYMLIIDQEMEEIIFGDLEQRSHVVCGGHPRTHFYQAFLRLAKAVWLLHRLAHSFDPAIEVFQVTRGDDFLDDYMESVVKDEVLMDDESNQKAKVGLMVMPGFVSGKDHVIKSKVYLQADRCV
ncbi:protein of unknown function DUF641 [Canna indica]|uniref:GIL1/IRKI C-terminal domain-containing protein n=1 Tax=Canna indica TaxID=4628 RepID=A0AAQ3L2L0_9LILI|nr:protein of unknown function DUF641 [Canna indica]